MLLFKAEADIQYRLHKVASCLPADSAVQNKHKHEMGTCYWNSNYAAKHNKRNVIELITPLI